MAKNKVRMADIAQQLGVSIVSVSKALSGKDGVSEQMRAKIVSLAQEMGYVLPGGGKKEGEDSGNIGIVVADRFFYDNTFYSNLYRTVLMKCAAAGYSTLLEIVSPQNEQNCIMPAMILHKKVDGLIFMGEIHRRYLHAALKSDLPYMLLDFYDDDFEADSVIGDNVAGSYKLTTHLIKSGREQIGFVGSIFSTSSIMDRYLGYTKALLRAGIKPCPQWVLEDRDQDGMLIPIALPQQLPQAFVCNCDEVAYNLVEQLKHAGLNVPEDIAVTGYDDYFYAQLCDPQLTTYRVNVDRMGGAVVSQLIRKIRGKRIVQGNIVIGGDFILRKSTTV